MFDRVLGGAEARFADIGVAARRSGDRDAAQSWGRGVSLVAVDDRVVVRAVSPIVDAGLALRGVLVLSMPLDGDFADGIKGALSADVLLGGPSGTAADHVSRRRSAARTQAIAARRARTARRRCAASA